MSQPSCPHFIGDRGVLNANAPEALLDLWVDREWGGCFQ